MSRLEERKQGSGILDRIVSDLHRVWEEKKKEKKEKTYRFVSGDIRNCAANFYLDRWARFDSIRSVEFEFW